MVLMLFVNSLTKFVRTNQHLTVLKKCPIFFIPTASTNIKTHRAKGEAGCSDKDCNQFLLKFVLKNYGLWH